MNLNSFFKKDLIIINKKYSSKEDALKDFAKILETKKYAKNYKKVLEKVLDREKEFSTGIGNEIAVPHIRDDVMNKSVILFSKIAPLNWNSIDNKDVKIIFFIALSKNDGESKHLDIISNLSRLFMDQNFCKEIQAISDYNSLISTLKKYDDKNIDSSKNLENNNKDNNSVYDIVAITACPTGIAHTFMAAQKLEEIAKSMDIKIKIETQGTEGSKNTLTQEEINNAKGVILAVDKTIDTSRFAGHKNVLEISTRAVIKDAKTQLKKSLNNEGIEMKGSKRQTSFEDNTDLISFDKFGKRLYKSLMTGVSYMLPFVVFGGILIAISFLADLGFANNPELAKNLGSITNAAKWFGGLGKLSFGLIIPILSAYIAYAIVGKFGLLPGFVCGLISSGKFIGVLNPQDGTLDWFNAPKDTDPNSGFFGAIIGGFLSAIILIVIIKYIFNYFPKQLNGIKNILFIPLIGTLLIGSLFWILNIPLIYVNYGFTLLLNEIDKRNLSVLLGLILGVMMAIDLGGPINKAAYVFAITSLTTTSNQGYGTIAMASAMGAGMAPPLGIALSCTFFKKLWTKEQRQAGYTNYIMGFSFISEGAIPFTTEQPKLLIPANIASGLISGLMISAFKIHLNAPHGGIFVMPLVKSKLSEKWTNEQQIGAGVGLFLLSIIIGAIISMLIIWGLTFLFNKIKKDRNIKYIN